MNNLKYLPIRNKDVNWGMYRRFKRYQWAAHAYVLNRKSAQWYVDKMEKVNKAGRRVFRMDTF